MARKLPARITRSRSTKGKLPARITTTKRNRKWLSVLKDAIDQVSQGKSINVWTQRLREAIEHDVDDNKALLSVERFITSKFNAKAEKALAQHVKHRNRISEELGKHRSQGGELSPTKQEVYDAMLPVFSKAQLDRQLHDLLDQKIKMSLDLIKRDRAESVNRTLQRFQGWASSISPTTGLPQTRMKAIRVRAKFEDRYIRKTEAELIEESKRKGKPISQLNKFKVTREGSISHGDVLGTTRLKYIRETLPESGRIEYKKLDIDAVAAKVGKHVAEIRYREQLVAGDQTRKLFAAIGQVQAYADRAIAFKWNHHFSTYPRVEHVERDGHIYILKNSWAVQQGFIRSDLPEFKGQPMYVEDLPTMPAQEINCRCEAEWIDALSRLSRLNPSLSWFTDKGLAFLQS